MTDIDIRLGRGSTILARRTFYAPSFLTEPDGDQCWLFVAAAAVIRTFAGREKVAVRHAVWTYPNEVAMVAHIEATGMVEAPIDFTTAWVPDRVLIEQEVEA